MSSPPAPPTPPEPSPRTPGVQAAGGQPGPARGWWRRAGALSARAQVLAWAGACVLLAALACALLPLDQLMDQRHDWQAEALAPPASAQASVVVDVDEATLQQLGHWPLPRHAYVPVAQWLQAQGARAIVFGVLMVDPREGDAELGRWLASAQVPVLVGTRSLPPPPLAPLQVRQAAPAGCMPHPVAAWQLPVWFGPDGNLPAAAAGRPDTAAAPATPSTPGLPLARLGVLSTPVDEDGRLRSWPLWQQAEGLALPSMPVAVWQALHVPQAVGLRCVENGPWGPAQAQWAQAKPWPTDAQGRVRPWLPRAGQAGPRLPLWQVAAAAEGRLAPAELDRLAAQVRGRVVFIGASTQNMGEGVLTGQGWREPTALLAASFDALDQGHLLVPPRVGTSLALMAWLCLPLLVALWAVQPRWRQTSARPPAQGPGVARHAPQAVLVALGLALAGLLGSDWLLATQGGQLSRLAWPVVSLLLMTGSALWWWRRSAARERLALHAARSEAQAAARIKSEFLAQVSHEVRTPLNALLGAAEMLETTPLNPEQRRHVLLFNSAGQELLGMLNDLLDLSKSEAGQLSLQRQPFSLTQLVAQQMALFEATLAHKGLALLTEAEPDLPDVVLGDGPRVAQVLRNLLSNAVKFTNVGSITLDLRFGRDRDHVRIEVRDTGIGIPADRLHQLFSPYNQAHGLASRRHGGTGLGLAISRRLVEMMGGTIGVDSREGLGTRFHFELPLPASVAMPQEIRPPSLASQPAPELLAAHARGDGRRVLVADDSLLNLVLARSLLEAAGYLVDTAADGAAALRQFEARPYDAVLLDLNMPVMDGFAAAQALREFERRRGRQPVRLLAVSGQVDPQDVAAALDAGFDDHLPKPYTRAQLLRLVAAGSDADDLARPPVVASAANSSWIDVFSRLPDAEPAEAASRLGSPQLFDRVIDAARDPLLHFEARLAAALDASPADGSAAHRLSHNLKTLAATIGLPGLARDAARLERALATADQPAQDAAVRLAREQVQARLALVRQALQAPVGPQAEAPGLAVRRAAGGGL